MTKLDRLDRSNSMNTLVWKSGVPKGCDALWASMNYASLNAKAGNVTYHADNLTSYGAGDRNRCWAIVTGPRGGKRQVGIGCYLTMEEAKLACEQHYGNGCDVSKAVPVSRYDSCVTIAAH